MASRLSSGQVLDIFKVDASFKYLVQLKCPNKSFKKCAYEKNINTLFYICTNPQHLFSMDKAKYSLEKKLHYIDFVTPDYGWVGAPYSLFQTTNGGVEWKTLINKTALDTLIEGFLFIDKNYGWMNIYEDNNNIS